MSQVTGVVERVTEKAWKDKKFFSMKVGGTFYGMGTVRNADVVQEGNSVTFDASQNDKGYWEVTKNTNVTKNAAPQGGGSSPPAESGGVDWAAKDASIQYQSSRKDALAMVGLLVQTGGIKLPVKESGKYDVIIGLVDLFTASYYTDIGELGALARTSSTKKDEDEPVPGDSGEE